MHNRAASILALLSEEVKKKLGALHRDVKAIYINDQKKVNAKKNAKVTSSQDHEGQLSGLYKDLVDMHPNRERVNDNDEMPALPGDYHQKVANVASKYGVSVEKHGNELKISGGKSPTHKMIKHPKTWSDHNELVSAVYDQKDGE